MCKRKIQNTFTFNLNKPLQSTKQKILYIYLFFNLGPLVNTSELSIPVLKPFVYFQVNLYIQRSKQETYLFFTNFSIYLLII